jgi:outer membrane biosynthesis protein TonB
MNCFGVVLCCSFALAQTSPTPVPPESSADQSNGPVEVLTDTMGVNFGPYLTRLVHDVKQQWVSLIRDDARGKRGKVVVEFAILKDGSVAGLKVVGSSGVIALANESV